MAERQLLETLTARIQPRHTALLIVDMQNDYVAPGGATERRTGNIERVRTIIPPLQQLLEAARSSGLLVVFIKMTLDPELRLVSDIEYMRRRARWGDIPVAVKGTWGHDVIAELEPQPGEFEVAKTRGSAFIGTNLDILLRSHYIRSVVVTGVVTNGCVAATARGAVDHDYYTVLARDCVASSVPALHDLGMCELEHFLGLEDSVVDSDRIIVQWRKAAEAGAEGRPALPTLA
jgi:nicotinamidase-related amidase